MIDGVKTYVGVTAAFISDPIHDYYTITDDGTSMQINLTLSAIGKSFQVPVKFTVNVPDGNGLKILVYSTADFLKVVA